MFQIRTEHLITPCTVLFLH